MKKTFILLGLILILANIHATKPDYDFSDNTVIVVLKPEYSDYSKSVPDSFFGDLQNVKIENLSLIHNPKAIEALHKRGSSYQSIYKITLPTRDKALIHQTIEILNKNPQIDFATPDYILPLDVAPNDPFYSSQWALHGTHGIQAEQAWDIATGSHAVRVGVIDTGIANHSDLDANVTTGYDFVYEDTVTTDDEAGHGTFIAGIIGSVGDNDNGISGVNWAVTIVPLQVVMMIGPIAAPLESAVLSAINYATNTWGTDEQISVINQSISGYGADTQDPRLLAINNYPGLFVWSAGNDGRDVDNFFYNYLDNVIAVGAIQSDGQKCDFSNYSTSGANVHVYAPGSSVLSTYPDERYEFWFGTSFSAPHVVGVAALLLSVNPTLTALQIKQIIVNSADDLTIEIPSGEQVVKRLNANNAVRYATSMAHIAVSPTSYNFGNIEPQQTSPNQTFTVSILGNGAYSVDSITLTGENADEFNLYINGLPWYLNAGGSETFTVSFAPTSRGAKTAKIHIVSNDGEFLSIIDLSGTGLVDNDTIPYYQDFNTPNSLAELGWGGSEENCYGIVGNWGISSSKGLALGVNNAVQSQYVYTTSLSGITANTVLSFAYRIINGGYYFDLYPPDHMLSNADKVYIEVSTTGATGAYTVLHEINSTNHLHIYDEPFFLLELPLSAYAAQTVNIRFRAVTAFPTYDYGWYFNLDDLVISDFPSPASITASVSANNVTLSWTPPANPQNLIGYIPFRDDTPLLQTPINTLTYTDENVGRGKYCYGVRAVYNGGLSNRKTILVDVGNVAFIPYTLDFNQVTSLLYIGWKDYFQEHNYSGLFDFSGVNGSKGLVLTKHVYPMFGTISWPSAYSPAFIGITEHTTLSFAYRIVNITEDWQGELTATTLNANDRVIIETSTTGMDGGPFTPFYEINSTNHISSTDFATATIPLADFNGQELNLLFTTRDSRQGMVWSCVIDDIVIADNATQGPPRELVATPDFRSVRLNWLTPASAIPLGYKVYRDGEAITGMLTALYYQDDDVTNGVEYTYYVTAVYADGLEVASEPVTAVPGAGAELDEASVVYVTALGGNYPNPFNPETVISFSLGRSGFVNIDVYNVRGQRVRALVSEVYEAGVHSMVWNGCADDGRSVGSGVYFYRMVSGDYVGVKKMLLLK